MSGHSALPPSFLQGATDESAGEEAKRERVVHVICEPLRPSSPPRPSISVSAPRHGLEHTQGDTAGGGGEAAEWGRRGGRWAKGGAL